MPRSTPVPFPTPEETYRAISFTVASDALYTHPGENKDPESVRNSHDTDDGNEMMPRQSMHRSIDGRTEQPLLKDEHRRLSAADYENGDPEGRPMLHHSRRPTIRSSSPGDSAKQATRRKYIIASGFLLLSLTSFVIQTETAVYIQHELHWDKPYCML